MPSRLLAKAKPLDRLPFVPKARRGGRKTRHDLEAPGDSRSARPQLEGYGMREFTLLVHQPIDKNPVSADAHR